MLGYTAIPFTAVDAAGLAVYHTNVIMCVAPGFAVVCAEAIEDEGERARVLTALGSVGGRPRPVIRITQDQVSVCFCRVCETVTAPRYH